METVNDTIGGMLETIAQRYPERDALIHREKGTRYTYQLLSWQVDQVFCGLAGLGIKRGDHVAIWAANIPEWLISMLAIAKLGAVFVPVDPGAGREDLDIHPGTGRMRGFNGFRRVGGGDRRN